LHLREKRLFLFDLDGVLSAGKDRPKLLGGVKLIQALKQKGRRFLILTNTSTHTREDVLHSLESLGFPISLADILSSAQLTAEYLRDKYGVVRYFLIGEKGFKKELTKCGHQPAEVYPLDIQVPGNLKLTLYITTAEAAVDSLFSIMYQ